jgi:hypothetical protein
MALKDFWNKLMGGDKVDRVEEEVRDNSEDDAAPAEDFEAMKDDAIVDERFRGSGTIGENSDL